MKTNFLLLLFIVLFSYNTLGQQGRNKNFVRQQQRMPTSKPKIHANSNSVFGTGNTHPKYNKQTQPKNDQVEKAEIKDNDKMKRNNDKPKKEKINH